MKQLISYTKKEFTEVIRTKKLLILTLVFLIFGFFNTIITWGTPKLLEFAQDELTAAGMNIPAFEVNATFSWSQFVSNLTMCMIVFIIIFAGILSREIHRGTLINIITKGMVRWKIIVSKLLVTTFVWTFVFVIYFDATYLFNMVFWDNSETCYLIFSMVCMYLVGIWVITSIMLYSSVFSGTGVVTAFTLGEYMGFYFLGLFGLNKITKFTPAILINCSYLYAGDVKPSYFTPSLLILAGLIVFNIALSVILFNKKEI